MADDKDSEYEDISARSMSTHQDQQEMSMPSINDSWFGKPVEEVDPLIFEDVFIFNAIYFTQFYLQDNFQYLKANFFCTFPDLLRHHQENGQALYLPFLLFQILISDGPPEPS